MPPRKRTALQREAEESDSDYTKWDKSQKAMLELKKQREKQFSDVVKESSTELRDLESELEEMRKKQREQQVEKQAKHITTLIDSMQRRKVIEKEMQAIVAEVQEHVEEVEQMMLVGFDGRLAAMNKVFETE